MLYLWVSRHKLNREELEALGFDITTTVQTHENPFIIEDDNDNIVVQEPLESIDEILNYANQYDADVIACVLPMKMKQELLSKTSIPIIEAQTMRVFNGDGEKYDFVFDGWKRYSKIDIETEPWQRNYKDLKVRRKI